MRANTTPTHRHHHPRHDYSQPCIYHITLVCSDRGQVLGRIVGETPEQARCELTPLGVAVSECIMQIEVHGAKHGHNLQVIAKVVMPDHVHFILYVRERLTDCKLGDVIRGFKQGCNKALRAAIEAQERAAARSWARLGEVGSHGMGANGNNEQDGNGHYTHGAQSSNGHYGLGTNTPSAQSANGHCGHGTNTHGAQGSNGHCGHDTQGAISSSSLTEGVLHPGTQGGNTHGTQGANTHGAPAANAHQHGYRQPPLPICSPRMLVGHALFEEDYDETILRRRGQLQTMIRYVHNNPSHRWQKQRHPDRLIPMRGIMIAGRMYDAIGNITLLGLERQQVWIRSRWDETTRRNYQNDCILKARQYHTLVSPYISPHEAAVRDVALQEGHPVIVLVDNGFSDYTQCPGSLYNFCVKGQVLMIVPSELPHISNKKTISRQECMMLNERAAEIANE